MDESLIKAATENFNLPHDVVILPTGGIFYKSKKKSIKVGYLTATDENYLMSGLGNRENIIMTLLRNKIYEHDLRPDELLEEDIQAVLLFLRNTSFGSEYKIKSIDPETGKEFEGVINLEQLDFIKPEIEPDSEGNFTVILPKSNSTAKIKPQDAVQAAVGLAKTFNNDYEISIEAYYKRMM